MTASFNLSETIRACRKSNRNISCREALASVRKANPKEKINEGTFKSTFYKLAGANNRGRLKRKANGQPQQFSGALTFIRECGSIDAARRTFDSACELVETAKEL